MASTPEHAPGAGVVFTGGALFDGWHHIGRGRAVIVRGSRIAAVVPAEDVRAVAPDLPLVDLEGGLLAPGFIDAHVHAVQGGLERIRCDLSSVGTREGYRAAIVEYAAAHPEASWILGGGWSMAAFPGGTATTADLDDIIVERPVYLLNRDHHGAWVNTRALELAGVDRRTPDPADGHLDRLPDGSPNGTLHEGAMDLVGRLLPVTSDEEHYRGFLEAQAHLHALGITGWQDAILGEYAGAEDASETYLRAATAGDLTATVTGALWWDRDRGVEQLDDLVSRRERYTHRRLRANAVKIMQDGIIENGTAAVLTPYLDRCGHATTNSGHSFVDADALRAAVSALTAAEFQVHVHAIGDRGVREALDALAAADRPDLRPHLAHLQLIAPSDVGRFAANGICANLQLLWACLDEQMTALTIPFLDASTAARQYPFGELAATGARLAAGSDWPVSSPDPLAAIHVGVNRSAYGEPGRAGNERFLPEQALTLERAFAAYTSGSAYVNHRDDAGKIAQGAVADLVVLDRDPFSGPVEEIGGTHVEQTWIDGLRLDIGR